MLRWQHCRHVVSTSRCHIATDSHIRIAFGGDVHSASTYWTDELRRDGHIVARFPEMPYCMT